MPNCTKRSKLCENDECQLCFEKSFASHTNAKFWSDKNILQPRQVFKSTHIKYWFKCCHEFDAPLNHVNKNRWCPYCSNKKLCNENCQKCFNKSFASHEKAQFWSNINELTARQVFKNSNKLYLFNCVCMHEFEITCNTISSIGVWCAYCANKKLCDDQNCQQCWRKSFANHEKAKYWSNKNLFTPRQLFKSSGKKILFNCCHEFQSTLHSINKGTWCPYCCNPPQKLCDNENCQQCFINSFASNIKVKYWASNISPRQVFNGSETKYLFICEIWWL